jgi:hypothetical protein
MEYCSLGDLSHYIKQARTNKSMKKGNVGGLPERVVRHFLKQLGKLDKVRLFFFIYLLLFSQCITIPKITKFGSSRY